MGRNASGVYTLPIGAFSPGGLIKSSDHNQNYGDIATALTQSIASTGVTPITGPLLGASGSVNAPSYTFNSSQTTGFYLAGTNQIGWAAAGVQAATFNSDKYVTWAGNHSIAGTLGVTGAATLSSTLAVTGNTTVGGTLGVTGNATLSGTLAVTGDVTMSATDQFFPAAGSTGQRAGSPSAGAVRYNTTLGVLEFYDGTLWILLGASPTVQAFTSGSSATYTPSTGVVRIKVRMCGGGGGGGAENTHGGGNGGQTSFASWTAAGGTGGNAASGTGGTGGSGGSNGTGTLVLRLAGSSGCGGFAVGGTGGNESLGMAGGANMFAGNGQGTTTTGGSAVANSGGGGAGGACQAPSSTGGGGGGAGEYVEFWVFNPSAITYTVGTGGSAGVAGGNGGGAGAAGIIVIEEFYA